MPATWDPSTTLLHNYCQNIYSLLSGCAFTVSVKTLHDPTNEGPLSDPFLVSTVTNFPSHRPISDRLSDLEVFNSNQDGELPPHCLFYKKLPRREVGEASFCRQDQRDLLPHDYMPRTRPPHFQDSLQSLSLCFILCLLLPSGQGHIL